MISHNSAYVVGVIFCSLQVETILGRRYSSDGGIEYLIRWGGYNSDWDTWEPAENLDCAQEAVEEFNSRIPLSSNMAANRPARTIKPPSKFLDSDLASVNGVPNHAETTGNVLGTAARKLSRSVSLTKDEGKTKVSPKRRASSIEASADEDEKSSGKISRQNSVSPSAKIKTPRKSGVEETPPVNGVEIVTGKEQVKSVKVNHFLNKGKVSPGARRQSISKSKVVECVGTDSGETIIETVKQSPSKLVTDQIEGNSCTTNPPGEDVEDKAPKRNRAKFSPTKLREKAVDADRKNPENINEHDTLLGTKKRRKPGTKPKQKINTKKLKTVVNKGKGGFAKTPKTTADRVKRKYAQKKSTFASTDSPKSSILEGIAETLNENNVQNSAENTAKKTAHEIVTSIARKRKPLKVVKLSTKPGKGRLSTKSALKVGKGAKQAAGKSTELTEQKLSVKRPRLKPGPKPKKLKFPVKNEISTVDKNLMASDYPKGSSARSSTEKVIRYKLDGSPCLKPGPKPKKLTEGNSELSTSSQLVSVNTGRSSIPKGKPGPKPKKPATEISEMQDANNKTESLASKGRKTSCERTEEMSMSPKNKSSTKGKKDIANIRTEQRKKPGPKPRKALSEPVKRSNEDASKIREGAKASKQLVENVDKTPNSQTHKGKPKTKIQEKCN